MDAPSSHAGRRADDASVSMRRAAAPVAAAAREVRRRLEQTGAVSSSSSGGDARRAVDRAAQSAAVIGTLRGLVQRRFGQRVDLQQIAGQSCPVLHRALGSIAELSPESTEPLRAAECVSAVDRIAERVELGPFTAVQFCEHFLAQYDASKRRRRGVFYTPTSITQFICRSVDRLLREEFGLPDGLADTTTWGAMTDRHASLALPMGVAGNDPFVCVLDPAAGSGAFLVEVVRRVYATLDRKWRREGLSETQINQRWHQYVPQHLLPRLAGFELMPVPCAVAQLAVVWALLETGYDFPTATGPPVQVFSIDTLAEPVGDDGSASRLRERPWATVVVGNPPFAGISQNHNPWIDGLLKGRLPSGEATESYYHVDGRPLGERKVWLQDDYVKFFRFAQWKLDQAECGVLGFIAGHGWLDGPTFRGMRTSLSRSLPRASIVDLHGNAKKRERSPDGAVDENVFAIEQGVAIALLRRPPAGHDSARIRHGELWGTRSAKLAALAAAGGEELATAELNPRPPWHFFYLHDDRRAREYDAAVPLTDAMPLHCTAAVTARDRFVVAFDSDELLRRIAELRDRRIDDDALRQKYFHRTRSTRYPLGDSRGWKLADARRRVSADAQWQQRLLAFQYRPLDWRYIYWAEWMVDWPRGSVMPHMHAGANLALVARRQMPPGEPCRYFWISSSVVVDGLIRSDNRGSESLFPLYRYDNAADGGQRRANFAPALIERLTDATRLTWTAERPGDLRTGFGAEDVLHFIYAQFFSPTYRERYAELLRIDFPRLFIPRDAAAFRAVCRSGRRLVELHAARESGPDNHVADAQVECCGSGTPIVAPGYPRFTENRVQINPERWFAPVPAAVWESYVGGHQVARKWLADRRGRLLSEHDQTAYADVVGRLRRTDPLMQQVDDAIAELGGWEKVFRLVS